MAKNVLSLQLLRNSQIFANKEAAIAGITSASTQDGVIKLARYTEGEGAQATTKTIFGIYHAFGNDTGYTIYDSYQEVIAAMQDQIDNLESGSTEAIDEIWDALGGDSAFTPSNTVADAIEEINNKLGSGVTTANSATKQFDEIDNKLGDGVTTANTVSDQLAALSGSASDTSATTSVEGAKKYADEKIGQAVSGLDYTDTAVTGEYVSAVNEVDGVISVTRVALPSVADSASAKTFVTSVSETNGQIAVTKGTVSSTGNTVVLTDNADGGINIEVASSALIEYVGDNETIQVSAAVNNQKTISSLLTIASGTSSETNVKEVYNLVDANGTTIGDTIKIYKDSSLVRFYLGHVDDVLTDEDSSTHESPTSAVTDGSGDTALVYIMQLADGNYQLTAVNVQSFLQESEFASGVTADSTTHIVHGVVDANSEKDSQSTPVDFLTVGENGFKISGIKDEIDRKIAALDATVGDATVATGKHVAVQVVEEDGVITAVTVTEDDIASADDLETLSGKTVTELESSNSSITVSSAATADGTVKYDVITDASKIKMSGYTSVTSGVVSGSQTVVEAVAALEGAFIDNEQVVAASLNDLETSKLENIVVNGVTGTVANQTATVTIDGADITLDGWTSGATGNVAATDSVNEAISKLDTKIAAAVAGGVTSVAAGSGITVDNTDKNNPIVSAKLTATADLPTGIAENAIKFDSTNNGMYVEYIDAGTY